MVLKDTIKSWKISRFFPLITLLQVIVAGWLVKPATAGG
jgi:hypothetical protein